MLGADIVVDPQVSKDLLAGTPGTYVARVVIPGVPVDKPVLTYFDRSYWNNAFAAQGIQGASVTGIEYVMTPQKKQAWYDYSSPTVDVTLDITFRYTPPAQIKPYVAPGGMGYWFIPAVSAITAKGVIAALVAGSIAWAALSTRENPIVKWVKTVAKDVVNAAGDVLKTAVNQAGGAISEAVVPVVLAVGAVALGIYMLKRSGARVRTGAFNIE